MMGESSNNRIREEHNLSSPDVGELRSVSAISSVIAGKLSPPKRLGLYPADRLGAPHKIDYEAHPAYSSFLLRGAATRPLTAGLQFARSFVALLARRIVRLECIPADIRSDSSLGGRAKLLGAALRNIGSAMFPGGAAPTSSPVYQDLARLGCSVFILPADLLQRLEVAAAPRFDELEERRRQNTSGTRDFEESRASAKRKSDAELFDAVEDVLERSGAITAASFYMGRSARLIDINPQINDTSDGFWRDIFPDIKMANLPDTAYFHRDASGGDIKAIIYLTDVAEQNGPFTYVVGSHALSLPLIDNLICEANDHNLLSGTDPESRAKFMALPRKLRQKGAFGNDLQSDSPASAAICNAAWSITGPKGAIVMFDTKGIHRGGMVRLGERRVITCVIG